MDGDWEEVSNSVSYLSLLRKAPSKWGSLTGLGPDELN